MKCLLKLLALAGIGLMSSQSVFALGVTAGTDITNTATASYTVGATPFTVTSNSTSTIVDELLNVTIIGQDAGSQVTVSSGALVQVQTYVVTNTGNGTDSYSFTATNQTGDDFDTATSSIYLDDGDNIFNIALDTLLTGSNDPALATDGSATIFVVSDIPGSLADGDIANIDLVTSSNTAVGAAGTAVAGVGDLGTDVIIGTSGGSATAVEAYIVSSVTVTLVKSAVISGPGGVDPVPGSTIAYSIAVTVTGSGTATGVVISDPIPADTTYVTNTLALDALSLTENVDADAGDVGATVANTITVNLGDLTAGAQTITFDVTIN